MYNRVTFIGNLGKDPVTRAAGKSDVCNFSIAVEEKKGETLWLNIQAWEKTGALCQQYLHKGSKVLVEGRLQVRTYEKDGQTRTSVDVVANRVVFLTPKGGERRDEDSDADDPLA